MSEKHEEYLNIYEIRRFLVMPKYQYTEEEVEEALKEYNMNNATNIILIKE